MASYDHSLAYLLELDGEEIVYEGGFTARFKVTKVDETPSRPHGIRYAMALHDPSGRRIMGYDNAHGVPHRGGRHVKRASAHDHWHRDGNDRGRPYEFTTAEKLIADFFDEIERVLKEKQAWQSKK